MNFFILITLLILETHSLMYQLDSILLYSLIVKLNTILVVLHNCVPLPRSNNMAVSMGDGQWDEVVKEEPTWPNSPNRIATPKRSVLYSGGSVCNGSHNPTVAEPSKMIGLLREDWPQPFPPSAWCQGLGPWIVPKVWFHSTLVLR